MSFFPSPNDWEWFFISSSENSALSFRLPTRDPPLADVLLSKGHARVCKTGEEKRESPSSSLFFSFPFSSVSEQNVPGSLFIFFLYFFATGAAFLNGRRQQRCRSRRLCEPARRGPRQRRLLDQARLRRGRPADVSEGDRLREEERERAKREKVVSIGDEFLPQPLHLSSKKKKNSRR